MLKACVFAVALLVGTACDKKPSRADCQRLVDHIIALAPKKDPSVDTKAAASQHGAPLIEGCVSRMTRAELQCALAARTLEALVDCEKKGK
jgi:hypothetical protein